MSRVACSKIAAFFGCCCMSSRAADSAAVSVVTGADGVAADEGDADDGDAWAGGLAQQERQSCGNQVRCRGQIIVRAVTSARPIVNEDPQTTNRYEASLSRSAPCCTLSSGEHFGDECRFRAGIFFAVVSVDDRQRRLQLRVLRRERGVTA